MTHKKSEDSSILDAQTEDNLLSASTLMTVLIVETVSGEFSVDLAALR